LAPGQQQDAEKGVRTVLDALGLGVRAARDTGIDGQCGIGFTEVCSGWLVC
jgi:hypothetical protein